MAAKLIDASLLRLMWNNSLYDAASLVTTGGEPVSVITSGEWVDDYGVFCGAEILIGGMCLRGDIKICDLPPQNPDPENDRLVLQVVTEPMRGLTLSSGKTVAQAVLPVDNSLAEEYARLHRRECPVRLRDEDPLLTTCMFTRMLVERLERKCGDVMAIHAGGDSSWNQTLYVMLCRTMGDNRNKEAFTALARAVPFSALIRERSSLEALEAMLLGGSGLLDRREDDDYIFRLKERFEHLRRKHGIVPLRPMMWNLSHINPYNSPVLRIVQLASFVASNDFMFDKLTECHTPQDVVSFFASGTSDYWATHFAPSRMSSYSPKKIGVSKAYLLGINLVAPLMFAYGRSEGEQELCDRALELLENIPPEDNSIVARWRTGGVALQSAFDSQAILQINNLYCERGRCGECFYGKTLLVNLFRRSPAFAGRR